MSTVDSVKNISGKAIAGAGSGVFGFESVTDVSLLSSVDNQLVMGLLGVAFLLCAFQVWFSIPDDLADL